jgi:hypothetical protein
LGNRKSSDSLNKAVRCAGGGDAPLIPFAGKILCDIKQKYFLYLPG